MGIRGLAKWLDANTTEACNLQHVPAGATLLVDGNGLCFHLISECVQARLGSYSALDATLCTLFGNLQRCGLRVVVYVDGPVTILKSTTLAHRRSERLERSERVQAACLDGVAIDPETLPEPPLMLAQLAASAASAGVQVVTCGGEADPELARACSRARDAGEACWVLGNDSDFLLYRGVCYLRFAEVRVSGAVVRHAGAHADAAGYGACGYGGGGAAYAGGGSVQELWKPHEERAVSGQPQLLGLSWSRDQLCEMSSLSPDGVLQWGVLLGNDHTAGFELSSFGERVASSLAVHAGHASPRAEDVRAWLVSCEAGAREPDGLGGSGGAWSPLWE